MGTKIVWGGLVVLALGLHFAIAAFLEKGLGLMLKYALKLDNIMQTGPLKTCGSHT